MAAGRPASEDGDRSSDSGRSVSSCSLGTLAQFVANSGSFASRKD